MHIAINEHDEVRLRERERYIYISISICFPEIWTGCRFIFRHVPHYHVYTTSYSFLGDFHLLFPSDKKSIEVALRYDLAAISGMLKAGANILCRIWLLRFQLYHIDGSLFSIGQMSVENQTGIWDFWSSTSSEINPWTLPDRSVLAEKVADKGISIDPLDDATLIYPHCSSNNYII